MISIRILTIIAALLAAQSVNAQKLDPVQWTLAATTASTRPGDPVSLKLTARIEQGWHLYSLTTPKGGPIPTTAN